MKGQLVNAVRFAGDQAMVDGTESGLQSNTDALNKSAKDYGMKINEKKTKAMRISKDGKGGLPIIDGKILNEVKNFRYLGSLLSSDGYSDSEVRCRMAMAKEVFMNRKELFSKSFDVNIKKKIVKCIILLYGEELSKQMKLEELKAVKSGFGRNY